MRAPRLLCAGMAVVALVIALACREDSGSPTGPASEPALATSSTPLAFSQLSGSGFNSCGVTTDFKAYCWGFNENGELGNGTTASSVTPVAVAGGHQFTQASSDGHHSCGLTTDGRAYCWGANRGALGDGTTIDRLTPVPVLGGLRFRQIQAGHSHTCGVTDPDGLAYCWVKVGTWVMAPRPTA